MIISLIILGFILSGMLAWYMELKVKHSARKIALGYALFSLTLFIGYFFQRAESFEQLNVIHQLPWIPFFNIEYLLAIDYLSTILVTLTLVLAVICVLVSWHEISEKSGFYYFNLLTAIAGIVGVFCAVDLFLFFFFWEVMLLPMTALIAIWGHENRKFAAIKFFIFTQVSSLLMLVAIIYMGYLHATQVGQWSFNYFDWLNMGVPLAEAQWLMLGFFHCLCCQTTICANT